MKHERYEEQKALFDRVLEETGTDGERVRRALLSVPRHRFVPKAVRPLAYTNRPLPIGHGQTISQPAVVAVMSAAVAPEPGDRCLELGTGSGYQTAVLAELCAEVYSIEYVAELARAAEQRLRAAGYGPDRSRSSSSRPRRSKFPLPCWNSSPWAAVCSRRSAGRTPYKRSSCGGAAAQAAAPRRSNARH
jgi:protein-L-isoaspartate(D-aspartate) O-methyltransferase